MVWDDDSGPSETIIDGKTGFKAKPYDIQEFAGKVVEVLNMNKPSMHAPFFDCVRENFSYRRHLTCLEEIIKNSILT